MAKEIEKSMAVSAGTVSAATALSRILGLIREQVTAYFFGAGMATDAFVAAFRIPNLLRDLFAEGALSSAFVPVFKDKLVKEGDSPAYYLASITITALIIIVGVVVALGIIFTPAIIYVSAKGFTFDPEKFELTVNLTRLMFIYLLLVSVSAVLMGILNSKGRFGVPALSPAMFNLGMILSPVILYKYFNFPIYTLAVGVIIGGIGQLIFQIPSLVNLGFRFRFIIDFGNEGIRRIGRLISPMILGLSASRINILINTLLASMLIEGAMSYLNYAYRLMHFPLGVFGVALGTVTLPKISGDASRNDLEQLKKTFHEAFGLAMFLVIPSTVYLIGFGNDLVQLVYQRGAFDPVATARTAQALYFYAFGLIGFAGVRVIAPAYYALSDSRRPMYYSIVSVIVNIGLNFAFMPLWGFAGLAAATSVAGLVNLFLLLYNLRHKISGINFSFMLWKVAKILAAVMLAYFIISSINFKILIGINSLWDKIALVTIQVAGLGGLYILFAWLLRIEELKNILNIFSRKIKKDTK
ncbi:MAG: murein biosynthesis integral membrane protein MurJ [Candidatus Zixiibacteriota bacterium]